MLVGVQAVKRLSGLAAPHLECEGQGLGEWPKQHRRVLR